MSSGVLAGTMLRTSAQPGSPAGAFDTQTDRYSWARVSLSVVILGVLWEQRHPPFPAAKGSFAETLSGESRRTSGLAG